MADYENGLEGTWHIIATTFPMWTSGNRIHPQITYEKMKSSPLTFKDTVCYKQKNRLKTIIGIDTLEENEFIWRGAGLLKLLKSKWTVIYIDEQVLIIKFAKSLVTPAGVDILINENTNVTINQTYIQEKYQAYLSKELFAELTWLEKRMFNSIYF
ncbi:hypothetical protein ACYSNW_05630 [Enterococcus sp. LJL99]